MSEKAPAFQFYPKDFLSDLNVMAMSFEERGVYITLLSICWLEGAIPSDLTSIARILGMKPKAFAKAWLGVCGCFTETSGGFVHPRLEKEREKQAEWKEKSRQGGLKSAAKRGATVPQPPLEPNANTASASPSSSASPKTDGGDKAPRAPKRGWKFVPEDWQPNERHKALARELGVDLNRQVALFRDHEFDKAKTDPDRAFSRWLRRAKDFMGNRAPNGSEASRFTAQTERKHYQGHANAATSRDGQAYVTDAERVRQWQLDNKDEAREMFEEIKGQIMQQGAGADEAQRLILHQMHQRILREKLMKVVA